MAGMSDLEREAEFSTAEIGMAHRQRTRRESLRKQQPQPAQAQEISGAAEEQRLMLDRQAQRHADAAADILFEPRLSGKALGRMNDLWKAIAAGANAGPHLATAQRIFRHRHDHRHAGLGAGRKRGRSDASVARAT